MKRILLGLLILILALQVALPTWAHEATYQIYIVTWRGLTDAEQGFMSDLQESGLQIEFIHRDAAGDVTRLDEIREEIRGSRPDLIYAFGTTVSLALAGRQGEQDPDHHITDIPMVFNIVADPLGAGLTFNLDGSGRNITGTSHLVPLDIQVNAIQALGSYTTIGAIYNPLESNSVMVVESLGKLLANAGIRFVALPIPLHQDWPDLGAIHALAYRIFTEEADMVYLPSDSFIITHSAAVVSAFHDHGIPTFSATEGPIREGGAFIGLVSNYFTVGRFAGLKARQILVDGRDPGKIPIEPLARFTFLINLDAMRDLRYYPPMSVLYFAQVVESH